VWREIPSAPTAAIRPGSSNRPGPTRFAPYLPFAIPVGIESWMRSERARLSRHADVPRPWTTNAKALAAFTRFLSDGRIYLTNNAAERALRGIAIGRKNWLFAGSDRGGERAAAMYTLIATAKLNNVDPQAWLADVLRQIADLPARRLHELLPWNWQKPAIAHTAAA
jgi:transposase